MGGWQGENLPVVSSRDIPPTLIPNLLSELQGLSQRLEENGIKVTQEESFSTARGGFSGEHSEENWHESSGGSFGINNPRKSSKRSRGGMSGTFHIDAGTRI